MARMVVLGLMPLIRATQLGFVSGDTKPYGLKAVVSEESKALAETAPLKITGDHAQRGGGIGTNGEVTVPVVIFLAKNRVITVHKVWSRQ